MASVSDEVAARWSRRRLLAALPAVCTLSLAACGGQQNSTQTAATSSAQPAAASAAATSAKPSASSAAATAANVATSAPASKASVAGAAVTLHMLERQTFEAQAFDIRIPQFMQQYPNIKVIRDVTPGDIIQKEATLAASDTLPDTVHSYLGDQSHEFFAANGILIDIEARLARDKVQLDQWFPALIEVMRIDGKLHGLPFKGQVLTAAYFYNQDVFDKAGVAYPTDDWTVDDLVGMAKKLTQRAGSETQVYGYGMQGWGGENWTGVIRNWDAEWLSADGKTSLINSKPVQTALQWHYDMATKDQSLAPMSLDPANKLFPQSKCAILGRAYCNYKSASLSPDTIHFKWNQVLPPKGPAGNRGGMFAGDAQAITRDSKHPDEAFLLIQWLCDKETGVQLGLQTKGSSTLGGRPDVYADPRILNDPVWPKQVQEEQLKSVQVLKGPYSAPFNFRALDIYKVRDDATGNVLSGKTQPDTAFLTTLSQQVQAILDQPRPTKLGS